MKPYKTHRIDSRGVDSSKYIGKSYYYKQLAGEIKRGAIKLKDLSGSVTTIVKRIINK